MGRISRVVVALLAAALLVADACAHTTTMETVEVEEDNQFAERCREMRPQEQLRSCERFVRQVQEGSRDNRWPWGEREKDMFLRQVQEGSRGMDNRWPWGEREKESFEQCCRELRNVDGQCRCDALGQVAREVQSHEQDEQIRQYLQDLARELPLQCGLTPPICWF